MASKAQERVDTALARSNQTKGIILGELTSKRTLAYISGLAPGLDPKALALAAFSTVASSPQLMRCTPASIVRAVTEAAKLRLSVDGALGHAYLVPFKNRREGTEIATMMIGYRGFAQMAYRSDRVQRLHMEVICAEDTFAYSEGVEVLFVHERPPLGTDRGERIGAYATAHLVGGGPPLIVVMDRAEIEKRRASSASFKFKPGESPWTTHPDSMWMKTAMRELAKRLPVPELQAAAIRDDAREDGRHAPPSMIDLGDADVVPDGEAKPGPDVEISQPATKPAAKPAACTRCGNLHLRQDGTCPDCDPAK